MSVAITPAIADPLDPASTPAERTERARRSRLRALIMFPVSFALVALLWEGYKAIGPANGGEILGFKLLPRTGDREMPHVWDMITRLGDPENGPGTPNIAGVVAKATWYSFRVALAAFVLGVIIGVVLAVFMSRFKVIERALMPYLVISQTIPIIGIAPVLVFVLASWSRDLGDQKWIAACILGAFLAFFPVTLGTLRGLKSAAPESVELMDSYAAGWWKTLIKLRLPASATFVAPSLRLAGAAAVIGVVVSEISVKINQGIGQLVLLYGQLVSSDPTKLFAAVFGAAVLGLAMSALVIGLEKLMLRSRPEGQ